MSQFNFPTVQFGRDYALRFRNLEQPGTPDVAEHYQQRLIKGKPLTDVFVAHQSGTELLEDNLALCVASALVHRRNLEYRQKNPGQASADVEQTLKDLKHTGFRMTTTHPAFAKQWIIAIDEPGEREKTATGYKEEELYAARRFERQYLKHLEPHQEAIALGAEPLTVDYRILTGRVEVEALNGIPVEEWVQPKAD